MCPDAVEHMEVQAYLLVFFVSLLLGEFFFRPVDVGQPHQAHLTQLQYLPT